MFAVLGEETSFCEWVVGLGGQATLATPTRHGGWAGSALVYAHAHLRFEGPRKAEFRSPLAAAFCIAFLDGEAPVEAAGRAVLVAAR